MKQKEFEFSRTKKKLLEYQQNGRKSVCWKLRKEQVDYIEQSMGREVIPYLYEVKTKYFVIPPKEALLKRIQIEKKRGKDRIVVKLSGHQRSLLDDYGIRYHVVKYLIILN